MSPEARQKISAACKGRVFSEQHRANLSKAARNRKRTPEQITAMRAGLARWRQTPEGIEAGRILGEESRRKGQKQIEREAAKYKLTPDEYRRLCHVYWSNHKRRKRHAGESRVDYLIRRANEILRKKSSNGTP